MKLTLSGTPRVRAHRADRGRRLLRRITAGPHEVEDGLGARGGPVADADLEHPNPAVHLVVGGLVQVDGRPPVVRPVASWIILPLNWLSHPNRTETVRRFRIVIVAAKAAVLHGDRHRLGPGDVYAITTLRPSTILGSVVSSSRRV